MRRIILAIVVVIAFVAAMSLFQKADYGRTPLPETASFDARVHPNPHIQTMLHQSCYNCHSAQGEDPWYGHVWPASRMLQDDVRRGRARLDFSTWGNLSPEMSAIRLHDACRMMRESKMPVWYYRPLHPASVPKPEDVDEFCAWAQTQAQQPSIARLQMEH